MKIPDNVAKLIDQIRESEIRWKAIYSANWRQSKVVERECNEKDNWNDETILQLEASDRKYVLTFRRFHGILVSRDRETALNHTVTIFSLLEKLARDVHEILYPREDYPQRYQKGNRQRVNFGNGNMLKAFLRGEIYGKGRDEISFEKIMCTLLRDRKLREFDLAKATRNCVIHNNGQADEIWHETFESWKEYKELEKQKELIRELEDYSEPTAGDEDLDKFATVRRVERWQDLLVEIIGNIEQFLIDLREDCISEESAP